MAVLQNSRSLQNDQCFTIVQSFEVSKIVKEINTFIQQRCMKLIKSDSKNMYNVTNISNSNILKNV